MHLSGGYDVPSLPFASLPAGSWFTALGGLTVAVAPDRLTAGPSSPAPPYK